MSQYELELRWVPHVPPLLLGWRGANSPRLAPKSAARNLGHLQTDPLPSYNFFVFTAAFLYGTIVELRVVQATCRLTSSQARRDGWPPGDGSYISGRAFCSPAFEERSFAHSRPGMRRAPKKSPRAWAEGSTATKNPSGFGARAFVGEFRSSGRRLGALGQRLEWRRRPQTCKVMRLVVRRNQAHFALGEHFPTIFLFHMGEKLV